MLVEIIDHKNKVRFINAGFVKAVHAKGMNKCQIEVSGWATKVTVNKPAQEVAPVINSAMPGSFDAMLAAEEERMQQQAAASAAAVG